MVKYEFIRMPDSTGFGDYTETGQVIPVRFKDAKGEVQHGGYVHSMYLDDDAPIAGGRELWGFPQEAGQRRRSATRARPWSARCTTAACSASTPPWATSTARSIMTPLLKSLAKPAFMIKIIPHVDGTPRVCELVRYYLTDITLKEAWTAPAALDLRPHVMADVAKLPVLDIVSAVHFKADLTLGLGEVVHDYLSDHSRLAASTTQPEKIRA